MLTWHQAFSAHPIAFGGAALSGEGGGYGFGAITHDHAIDLIKQGFEGGMRIFDTAPIYGFGLSEKRLGEGIKPVRDEVFVVSKCGVDWDDEKNVAIRNDAKTTQRMLDSSLKTLDLDVIDLYMVHWPDPNVDIRHTMEILVKAQEQGKIRYIGLCNTNRSELDKAYEIGNVDIVQNQFHVFERSSLELFPYLKEKNAGFMSWGTLDKGIISGTVGRTRTYAQDDVRSNAPWWTDEINAPKIAVMEKILPWLKERNHSGLEFALSHNLFAYKEAEIHAVALCGARNSAQLEGLLSASKNLLTKELFSGAMEFAKGV